MRLWRVWVGFGISFVFLFLASRGQNFEQIWEALHSADYVWLVPALIAYFAGVAVRAVRWDYLLRSVQRIPPLKLFPIVVIGYMGNNILPLRAGEIVRSYALSARFKIRKTSSIATITVERIFDGMTMLLFVLIASLSIALTNDLMNVAIVAFLLFVALIGGLLIIVFAPMLRDRLLTWCIDRMPTTIGAKVEQMAGSFIVGLGIMRRKQDLLSVALTSILAWLLEASMYMMVAEAFHLELSPSAILMVTAIANLATIIPSSPGYVGPFEAGVLLVLTGALDISREIALSYAVVVHAALYFPVTLLGFVYWWRESLSWREMRSTEEVAG